MNDLYTLVYILVMERFREFYFNFLFCYSRLCDRVRKGKHITWQSAAVYQYQYRVWGCHAMVLRM